MPNLTSAFKDHPASVGETYGQHMAFAFGFSLALFKAAFAALIHAIFPCFFEKTASQAIRQLHARIENR